MRLLNGQSGRLPSRIFCLSRTMVFVVTSSIRAETATEFLAFHEYTAEVKARSLRLYAIFTSHLKGRSLKILRAETQGDGFRVWRQLSEELPPSSRPRALALAQALTRFPPFKDGGSVLEYTLTSEKLVNEI